MSEVLFNIFIVFFPVMSVGVWTGIRALLHRFGVKAVKKPKKIKKPTPSAPLTFEQAKALQRKYRKEAMDEWDEKFNSLIGLPKVQPVEKRSMAGRLIVPEPCSLPQHSRTDYYDSVGRLVKSHCRNCDSLWYYKGPWRDEERLKHQTYDAYLKRCLEDSLYDEIESKRYYR